jgi:hypothetical protein
MLRHGDQQSRAQASMPSVRRALAVVFLLGCSLASGCTLAKPLVGVVTGPVIMLGHSNGDFGGGCGCDGRAVVCVFLAMSAIGAGAGLVTGIISDVQAITGQAHDPIDNWWDPFATNTGSNW